MPKKPKITFTRIAGTITLILANFEEGDIWNVYRAPGRFGALSKVGDAIAVNTFQMNDLPVEQDYLFRMSLNDFPIEENVDIISDNPEATPPTIEFEVKGQTTATAVLQTFAVSWGPDLVDLPCVELENFIEENELTEPIISIGERQTL